MSGGFGAGAADGVEYDHRGHEGRQLRIAGHRELVGVGVEQEVGDVAAGRADASSTSSHEGWSTQAEPMPGVWDP